MKNLNLRLTHKNKKYPVKKNENILLSPFCLKEGDQLCYFDSSQIIRNSNSNSLQQEQKETTQTTNLLTPDIVETLSNE